MGFYLLVKLLLCWRGSLLSAPTTTAPTIAAAGSAPTGRTRRLDDGTSAGADTAATRSRSDPASSILMVRPSRGTPLYYFMAAGKEEMYLDFKQQIKREEQGSQDCILVLYILIGIEEINLYLYSLKC